MAWPRVAQRLMTNVTSDPAGRSRLLASSRSPCRFACVVQLCEHSAGIVEEGTSGLGQFDTARLAAKELDIELPFEGLDLLAERRLLHAKPLCSPRDPPFLSDSNKITNMP